MFTKEQQRLLLISSLGGILEFYDFIIYALFASYIAKTFFPATSPTISLLATFATFAVGYLARPLGGLIFGHFGDRYGRKKTFMISILMMALATLGIALTPGYAEIGILAPVIITFCRIAQGFSLGGEIPGSLAYISESVADKKSLACGIIFAFLIVGVFLGTLVQAILSLLLTKEEIIAWGFRLPFLIGGILGFFSYLLRTTLMESPEYQAKQHLVHAYPFIDLLREELRTALLAIFIVGLQGSTIVLLFIYMPVYLSDFIHLEETTYIWWLTGALFFTGIMTILLSTLERWLPIKSLLYSTCILIGVGSFLIYNSYATPNPHYAFLLMVSAVLVASGAAVVPYFLTGLFPTTFRYTGIAFCYNFGFAIFAGLAPLAATSLIYYTGQIASPAYYLMALSAISLICISLIK